jgi:hypothetical protein
LEHAGAKALRLARHTQKKMKRALRYVPSSFRVRGEWMLSLVMGWMGSIFAYAYWN